jgi:hypothetical protein
MTRCARCDNNFQPRAASIMVREIVRSGNTPYKTIIAACRKCLTDVERDELWRHLAFTPKSTPQLNIVTDCWGCSRPMIMLAKLRKSQRWPRVCSERCRGRVRRRPAGKSKLEEQKCKCGARFMPKRIDAIHCSAACKQRAYRQRLVR